MSNIQTLLNTSDLSELDEATLIGLLTEADDAYFNDDQSLIPDSVYDSVRLHASKLYPTNVYFTGVGSEVRGGKIKLPYTMGSLNQIYIGDYTKWLSDTGITVERMVVSDKLDGASNMMVFGTTGALQIAYSRGDALHGADITRHLSKIHNVPTSVDLDGEQITVRAETIISPKNFEALKKLGIKTRAGQPYKNPRNMVSGLMNSSDNDPRVYDYIDVVAYEIVGSPLSKSHQLIKLLQLGFSVVRHKVIEASKLSDDVLAAMLADSKKHTNYEIDGLVIDIDSKEDRARLSDKNAINPKYAVKFKIADASNFAHAKVIGVEWNLSKHGYYKPKIKLEPTELVGVTVRHATGFNAKFIVDNKIGPGAVVAITRSGDVIPYVMSVVEQTYADLPSTEYTWNATGVDIVVSDASNNTEVLLQRLVDFFTSLDVPRFKEGNIKSFVELGITNPATIIDMTREDIISVVGSTVIGKEIYAGITEKLQDIPEYVLMGSATTFGRGVGVRKMKKLWEAFKGDMSKCADADAIVAVEGFDDKTAAKITNGYPEYLEFFTSILHRVTIKPYVEPVGGPLNNLTFVFTGFRDSSLEQAIVDRGGKMGSGVSGNTSYLVTTDPDSNSGKSKKARDLGVAVIGVEALRDML